MNQDIQTKRLQLREMQLEDAPALFEIWSDPDVTKFILHYSHSRSKQGSIHYRPSVF
ncbi:GNAT family N-acetyltransferase [Bacillus sp. FSL W7-1360]